jgi:hypothetical protein
MDPTLFDNPDHNIIYFLGLLARYNNTLDKQTDGWTARESTEIVVNLYMEVKCTSDIYRML